MRYLQFLHIPMQSFTCNAKIANQSKESVCQKISKLHPFHWRLSACLAYFGFDEYSKVSLHLTLYVRPDSLLMRISYTNLDPRQKPSNSCQPAKR